MTPPAELGSVLDAGEIGPLIVVASMEGAIAAVRVEDGTSVWQLTLDPPRVAALVGSQNLLCVASHAHSTDPGIRVDRHTHLTALRPRDGTVVWRVVPSYLEGPARLGLDGDVLMASASEGDGAVCAFDARTGRLRWLEWDAHGWSGQLGRWATSVTACTPLVRTPLMERIIPALVRWAGSLFLARLIAAQAGTAYVVAPDPPDPPHLSALDTRTRRLRWHYHQSFDTAHVSSGGTRVVVRGMSPHGEPTLTVLDAHTGAVAYKPHLPSYASVLALTEEGIAYVDMRRHPNSQLAAVRLEEGTELWQTGGDDAPGEHGVYESTQLVIDDEFLCYVHYIDQRERVAEVGVVETQTGRQVWRWRSPAGAYYGVNAISLVGGWGRVYVATRLGLFALRVCDGSLLWHALPTTDLSFIMPVVSPGSVVPGRVKGP